MDDWIGEAGSLMLSQPDAEAWTRVAFTRPLENPVVVATANTAHGMQPFTLAIRDVTARGFALQLDEWDYLDGRHVAETVSWLAVEAGRHGLPDGRRIVAGTVETGATGRTDVALAGFADAPLVFAETQTARGGAAAEARVADVTADRVQLVLQEEEASATTGHVPETLGWIAIEAGPGALLTPDAVTHAPFDTGVSGAVLIADLQSQHGPDPATLRALPDGRLLLEEETSADPETWHTSEIAGVAAFEPGGIGRATAAPAIIERWSDPATWGGTLPGPHETVVIDAGRTVLLDTDAAVAGLSIAGTLLVEDRGATALEAGGIIVEEGGAFRIGTPEDRHESAFTLTLTDARHPDGLGAPHKHGPEVVADPRHVDGASPSTGGVGQTGVHKTDDDQTAFLMAMGEGASIEIWGADAAKASWTQLAATAEAGARQITVADATGWEVGDRIAIASADFEMDQAEEAVITAISARTLTLDRPLAWTHFGEIQTYSNGERAWDLDSRAEVALLSRNVTIRGDGDSPENGIGGHIMAMAGAEMRLSGVELVHMGQAGALGRYPVHWHMLGDAVGQFIEDASIHHSFNRAVTIHGTGGVRVSDTVAYDVIGHAYFLEDGLETGNLFERNLGFVTRAADPDAATTPTDASHVSTFWITNPSNDFIGNRAAGSDHGGFWFALPERVLGLSAHTSDGIDMSPAHMPLGLFYQNTGHSNAFANLAFDGQADPVTGRFVETEYRPDEVPKIRDFTSYKSGDRAIWIRATAMDLHNVKSADNARATFFSYNQTMYDSLIVGRSANIGTPETPSEIAAGRSLPDPFNGRYFRGHSIYDGPSGLVRVHFAGFQDADAAFQTNGAAQKSPAHFVTGITFDDVTEAGRVDFSPTPWVEYLWSSGLRDLDGSLTGIAGATVLPILATSSGGESRFNVADGLRRDDWGAWIDPDTAYGLLRADTDLSPGQADQVLWQRSDGETIRSAGSFSTYHQTNIALDTDLTYRLQYHALPGQLTLSLRFAGAGESAIIEIPSLPTEIGVLGAAWATSRSELEAAETTTVWRDGQSLWVKLVAETDEVDPRFVPNSRLPEATARRHTAGIFVDMGGARAPVIADFATPPPAALDPHRAHLEMAASGQSIGWQVLDNGDAMSGHADFSVPIDRSDWTGYGHLRVEGTANGSAVEVLLEDASEGLVALGRLGAGTTALDLSNLPTTAKDEVDRVIFRTAEPVAGEPAEIALFAVTLDAADLITVPVVIGAPARAGETFGIVSDAIKGPQKADGPLTVVAVGEAHGGRVATGLPGQADHVFFTPDPGWLGPASFRVSLSDGAGRTAETTVHLDVVT